jgi:hypothetical protein
VLRYDLSPLRKEVPLTKQLDHTPGFPKIQPSMQAGQIGPDSQVLTGFIARLVYSKTTQFKLCYSKRVKRDKADKGDKALKGTGLYAPDPPIRAIPVPLVSSAPCLPSSFPVRQWAMAHCPSFQSSILVREIGGKNSLSDRLLTLLTPASWYIKEGSIRKMPTGNRKLGLNRF